MVFGDVKLSLTNPEKTRRPCDATGQTRGQFPWLWRMFNLQFAQVALTRRALKIRQRWSGAKTDNFCAQYRFDGAALAAFDCGGHEWNGRTLDWRLTNDMDDKTHARKARRGIITRHCGSQKKGFKKCKSSDPFLALTTAAGTAIVIAKLRLARKNGGNGTGPASVRMLWRSCSHECGMSQPANRAGWYAPHSWCEQIYFAYFQIHTVVLAQRIDNHGDGQQKL